MVLGFGSKKKKPVEEPVVRPSPSLPQLKEQRIPWPENLVDIQAVYATDYPSPPTSDRFHSPGGVGKVSFQSTRGPIPFHKPFRESTEQAGGMATPRPGNVAGLYGTGVPPPPSSFNGVGPRSRTATHPRTASRRARHAPNFNIMVVGAKKTGKTSLLRLLLSTSNISPTNTAEQLATLASYRFANFAPTAAISTACVEILQSAPNRIPTTDDRIALTCIDTPGLDFTQGREFALERTVSDILKYLDTQFAETMGEESKVVRTSKGDQHVHLCIYLIDPDSVMTPTARQARSRWTSAGLIPPKLSEGVSEYDSGSDDDHDKEGAAADGEEENGEAEGDHRTDKKGSRGNHDDDDDEEDDHDDGGSTDDYGEPEQTSNLAPSEDKTPRVSMSQESHMLSPPASPPSKSQKRQEANAKAVESLGDKNRVGMSPAEVRVISRLCKRVNLLPVISRADTLTDDRLKRVKQAVRRDLQAADGIGIWGIWDAEPGTIPGRMGSLSSSKEANMPLSPGSNGNGVNSANGGGGGGGGSGGGDLSAGEDDRPSRPVIKLRGPKRGLTRSRSRKSLKSAVDAEYEEPDIEASPGYPISPTIPNTPAEGVSQSNSRRTSAISARTDAGQASYGAIFSRADLRMRMPLAIIAPEKERPVRQQEQQQHQRQGFVSENGEYHVPSVYGRFVRRFRWGTIDVLDPHHCDFAALRAAIFGSYMKSLKATTKDILYERFRTEKLLARRATANISEEERKRMIEDLGL